MLEQSALQDRGVDLPTPYFLESFRPHPLVKGTLQADTGL
jgi:hypothetical protein